ncbi:uncharacterized protein [Palaemon carinicauda]|uniref:uncharacterized protein n=1 Tax=Palaemon carinicauda TaxID=392227 RepID=UPI0035B5BF12
MNTWYATVFPLSLILRAGISDRPSIHYPRGESWKPLNQDFGRKQLCSPEPITLDWEMIKHRLIPLTSKEDIGEELLLRSRSPDRILSVKWCLSEATPCPRPGLMCSPGPLSWKSTAFAVSADDKRFLVSLDYLEAERCLCKTNASAVDLFPIITKVIIAKQCHYKGEQSNDPVVADEGGNVTMSFPYATPLEDDAPFSIMILKAFGQTRTLVIDFMIRIKNTQHYDDPKDWRARAEVSFVRGAVELLLRNVTYEDEGSYLCKVEFLSSSSCFSTAELSVLDTATDAGRTACRPQMTKPRWTTFQHHTTNSSVPIPLVLSRNFSQEFLIQKCESLANQCQAAYRQCVTSTTRENTATVCVPDTVRGDVSKMEVRYVEDETCACAPKEVFQADSISEETVHIMSMKKVGTCPKKCQPEEVVVQWRELKEYLNKWTSLNLNASIKGQALKVKKCYQSLTPCIEPNLFCQVAEEVKTRRRIKLKNVNLKINLKFIEARKCDCREREDATPPDLREIKSPPVITYAKVGPLRAKKKSGKD